MSQVQKPDHTLSETTADMTARLRLVGDDEPNTLLARALDYAVNLPDADTVHPRSVDVAEILQRLGVDETMLIATLLSDSRLRDSLPADEVQTVFGDDIAELVSNVQWLDTFKECEHEQVQSSAQAERLRRMLLAMVKDIRALLIKLAYRVQRLRILSLESYDRRRCIARETLDIYAPLANRLGVAQLRWEMEDLAFRYLEPQVYKRLVTALEESRAARESYIGRVVEALDKALAKEGIKVEISGRPKHIYSVWRKTQRKGQAVEELYDLRAIRVIAEKVSDCYAALGVVHSLWQHIPKEFDDYIANPKDNGYRSLHTAVVGPGGRVIEVQIRTREMHEFAERGVAAHWLYKEGGNQDPVMQRSIASLQQMLETDQGDLSSLDSFHTELFKDRVFILTPKGDVQDLPRGATPLDFAYSIHTQVGHRCRGAKVNGRIVPLTYTLQSGERVEILTAKQRRPSRDWLNPHLGYLHTSRARAKVRHWFKEQDREHNIHEGRITVERELHRLGVDECELQHLVSHFNLCSVDDLYAEVGRGEISAAQIASVFRVSDFPEQRLKGGPPRESKAAPEANGVVIQGVGNLLTQIARCCKPMPGDSVLGYITRGKGVTVHRKDCRNVLRLSPDSQSRMIEVSWGSSREVYPVDVRIAAYDRQGLLRDITTILGNEKVNLLRANTLTNKADQTVTMELTLEIADTGQLSKLLNKFLQVPNVLEARRLAG